MSDDDDDARRRQAIVRISHSLMTLTFLIEDERLPIEIRENCREILGDLTRARYLLVEHEPPDNLLDELAQL
jgi:hypothetical protein